SATASFVTWDLCLNTLSTFIRRRSILIRNKRCRTCATTAARYGRWNELAPFGGNLQRPPDKADPHDQRGSGELTLDPFTMALWGLIVAGSLAIGFLSAFAGLAVAVPEGAPETWHLYRKVVEPAASGIAGPRAERAR